MSGSRVGWGWCLGIGCVLAGCGAPPAGPSRPPTSPAADAGVPPIVADAAGLPAVVDAEVSLRMVEAGTPPAPVDAGIDAGPTVRLAPTTLLTGADLTKAEVLAADSDGIYWVTTDDQLWMLPRGGEVPRQLASEPNPTPGSPTGGILLARGNDLFWSAGSLAPGSRFFETACHRTRKTGGDVELLPGGCPSTADDAYLYYLQGQINQGDVVLVALPLDAAPGTVPTTLLHIPGDTEVDALAVDDNNLYWTEGNVGSSVHAGTGLIWRADKASLLGGDASGANFVDDYAYLLAPAGGSLYFAFEPNYWSAEIGRVADADSAEAAPLSAVSILPLPADRTLTVLDGWVVTSTVRVPTQNGTIYAASADAVVGGGPVAVEIADGVSVPPAAGPPGLVFVDDEGHLKAISRADLAATVAGTP